MYIIPIVYCYRDFFTSVKKTQKIKYANFTVTSTRHENPAPSGTI